MPKITPFRQAGNYREDNTQKQGRSGGKVPIKMGPAVSGGASPSRRPNGGAQGGVFRTPKGKP